MAPAVKWADARVTAKGQARAVVKPGALKTLWVNTGTLCNIECGHCYIESSPRNDRLAYIRLDEFLPFLDEARGMGASEVAFTGGEPFMNPDLLAMVRAALERGLSTLILTNAMAPMMRLKTGLLSLLPHHAKNLRLRVSLDHHTASVHDAERGPGSFAKALEGLRWLCEGGFSVSVAGRAFVDETEAEAREGYLRALGRDLDLTVFPEMGGPDELPEITTECWGLLGKTPDSVMCASSRMLVKRRGASAPTVVACTLIPYDERFELGTDLRGSWRPVSLQHPHCASFCVLGGASCSV